MTSIAVPFSGSDLVLEPVDVPDATVPNVGDEGTTTIQASSGDELEPRTTSQPGLTPQGAMDSVWRGFLILMGLAAVVAIARNRVT